MDSNEVLRIGAKSFLGPLFLSFVSSLAFESQELTNCWYYHAALVTIPILISFIVLHIQYRKNQFHQAVINRSLFLSLICGIGLRIVFFNELNSRIYFSFGTYLIVLSIFHFTEFESTAWINPRTVSIDSFLLNHSFEYHLALVLSFVEFCAESYYFQEWKFSLPGFMYFGLFICVFGEVIRKLAMFTAGSNFNHVIQTGYESNHTLITSGIYAICRHPSYVGWFYWSLGTQLILLNPLCLIGYTIASWNFFHGRIYYEEITLINFFGQNYWKYKQQVPSGLPFINGY